MRSIALDIHYAVFTVATVTLAVAAFLRRSSPRNGPPKVDPMVALRYE